MPDDPTPWLDSSEQATWRAYLEGSTRLSEALTRQLENDHGLTLAEYAILVRLDESDGRTLRMSALAESLAHTRSRTTHTVHRLERRGLVRRVACPLDGRGVDCVLTDEGHEALVAAAPGHVRAVRRHLLDLLPAADAEVLARLMRRVAAAAR